MSPRRGRLADFLLRPLQERERAEVLADLRELREHRARERVRAWASLRYGLDVIAFAWMLRVGRPSARIAHPGGIARRPSGWREVVESITADLRYGLRGLVRKPGVSLVALSTLALAIGATTAIFSFADALLLRPLPVREPDRLLALHHVSTGVPVSYSEFSFPDFVELRDQTPFLEGVAAHSSIEVRLGEGLDAEPVEGEIVSGNYFDVLGVEPLVGRSFLPDEDRTPGTHAVAVIGEGLWERRLGRAPSVLGASVVMDGRPFTVVGVVPRAAATWELGAAPEVWVPLMMHDVVLPSFQAFGTDLFGNRGTHWLDLLARLPDGATARGVAEPLRALARRQAEENPVTNGGWSILARNAGEARVGPPGSRPLVRVTMLLGAVVAMVLLIACANVANLLLARAAERRREMAVRVAIGAARGRLIRQVLTEALTLSLLGGAAGVGLALWLLRLLPTLGLTGSMPGLDVQLDPRVLSFALSVSLLTGIAFGLVPALQASSVNVAGATGDSGLARHGITRGLPLRELLVVMQVALSLVLLVGAGLTLQTVRNLRNIPLGFETRDVRVASVDLSAGAYDAERNTALYQQLLDRVRGLPGVHSASLARIAPFSSGRMANDVFWEAQHSAGSRARTNVDMNVVAVDYFETLGIPVVRGRAFTADDRAGARDVAVVNQALAQRLWPGEDPIGKRLWSWHPNGPDRALDVVGVVGNGRYYRSWRTADRTFVFLPLLQNPGRAMTLHVRGTGPAAPTPEVLRREVAALDPVIPPPRVRTLSEAMSRAIGMQRASARLLSLFGLLATIIAAIGIYGVVSFAVTTRTHEIGVRLALGARPLNVRRLVILGSARSILSGTALGFLIAWNSSRFVEGLLYGVRPRDPATFAAVGLGLVAIGLLASCVPARRATRVDPLCALRG